MKKHQLVRSLALTAIAVLVISGCCSAKKNKTCCMDKHMSGKMMNDSKMMPME